MSAAQRKSLHTGGSAEAGQRTDSMMILHVGAAGPTLISLPRASNVTIPQYRGSESGKIRPAMGANKLNASYAFATTGAGGAAERGGGTARAVWADPPARGERRIRVRR
jgi:anionic cell wall polymer biosynthesis LytR-Cps2A-Psr (LCP) family protein